VAFRPRGGGLFRRPIFEPTAIFIFFVGWGNHPESFVFKRLSPFFKRDISRRFIHLFSARVVPRSWVEEWDAVALSTLFPPFSWRGHEIFVPPLGGEGRTSRPICEGRPSSHQAMRDSLFDPSSSVPYIPLGTLLLVGKA